jgi:uncharacterized membrane protein YjfL (UPF0719 family)
MNTATILTASVSIDWNVVLASALYALMGIVIFIVAFIIVDLITPYDLWKELVEKKNTALAIVIGMAALGICIIVAAAIH